MAAGIASGPGDAVVASIARACLSPSLSIQLWKGSVSKRFTRGHGHEYDPKQSSASSSPSSRLARSQGRDQLR